MFLRGRASHGAGPRVDAGDLVLKSGDHIQTDEEQFSRQILPQMIKSSCAIGLSLSRS